MESYVMNPFGLTDRYPGLPDDLQAAAAESVAQFSRVIDATRARADSIRQEFGGGKLGVHGLRAALVDLGETVAHQLGKMTGPWRFGELSADYIGAEHGRLVGELRARQLDLPRGADATVAEIRAGRIVDRLSKMDGPAQLAELMRAASGDDCELLRAAALAPKLDGLSSEHVTDALELHAKIHHPDHARRIAELETALSAIAFNRAMAKRAVERLLALPPAALDANGEAAA